MPEKSAYSDSRGPGSPERHASPIKTPLGAFPLTMSNHDASPTADTDTGSAVDTRLIVREKSDCGSHRGHVLWVPPMRRK